MWADAGIGRRGGRMDSTEILRDYEEFAREQYMKVRSQCCCHGELEERMEVLRKDLRWEPAAGSIWEAMDMLMRKEIDSVLKMLPIQNPPRNKDAD
nr:hypothetical protein [uncultured Acetatifactor sp.]